MKICSIDGCGKALHSRGWCEKHYRRWQRHGDPHTVYRPVPASTRFWAKVQKSDDCWLWTGGTTNQGYGIFAPIARSYMLAHRQAYEWLVGPIPDKRHLDHLPTCPKRCVNPSHLRLATIKQNGENRVGLNRNNTSGYRGVNRTQQGRWAARVWHNGAVVYVGTFDTPKQAGVAAQTKRNELYTHNVLDRAI